MAIITISRGSASGGLMLAEGLARKLGYKVVTREEIIRRAARRGVSEDALEKALLEPPGFWDRVRQERRRYLIFFQEALCEQARNDDMIYVGNAGHMLLQGISNLLCVRLIAPLEFRVRVLVEREHMSREEAMAYVEKVDRQRRDWTRLLYGVDWLDPSLYDLIINLQSMTVETAVEVVASAACRPEYAAGAESRKAMADLLLASKVRAELAADARTASAEVEVRADAGIGSVALKGKVRPASMVDAVVSVVRGVEGVKSVDRDYLDAPEYTV